MASGLTQSSRALLPMSLGGSARAHGARGWWHSIAAARVRERRRSESRAERRRGAAADDERSRRCRHLFTGAGRAGGGSSCRARARVAPPQRRVALSVGAARPTMMKEVEGAFAFSPPPPSPSPSPTSPSLPPPSPFATVADALTVAPPLTTQPVAAAALFAAAHPPSPPLPSTSRRTRLRLHRRPLAACRPRRCSSPTLPWNSKCAKLWGRGHAVLASLLSLTSCYALLILFGCLRVCAPTQITLNSACVAKTRPPPMPLRRHSHPHHPSRHAQ